MEIVTGIHFTHRRFITCCLRRSLFLLVWFAPFVTFAQNITVSGTVRDRSSGEALVGANILNSTTGQGALTNNSGFYSITLKNDSIHLHISFVGYRTARIAFRAQVDTLLNIELNAGTQLGEVVVTGQVIPGSQPTSVEIPVGSTVRMPALLGETDVLKTLQLVPGVQSGMEGTSSLHVRGGGADQNLILLDGVPIYNASHLFGFLSVFNADAINHVELTKGGFPARFGGRLSSVVDITMREGNKNRIQGTGSLGILASRLTLEGPLGKNTSFIVSGRRTYLDLLAKPVLKSGSNGDVFGYNFYDLNVKLSHQIDEKNRLYLSIYTGRDKATQNTLDDFRDHNTKRETASSLGMQWGNSTTALRWNSTISNKVFANLTATYSRYEFDLNTNRRESTIRADSTFGSYQARKYLSNIIDYTFKGDFEYLPSPQHYIRFGGYFIRHDFSPGVFTYRSSETNEESFGASNVLANEFAVYAEDDFLLTNALRINAGVHVAGYRSTGATHWSVQPRIIGTFQLTKSLSFITSYARTGQYIHLLANAAIGLPTDLWLPTTKLVPPEGADIACAGAVYEPSSSYKFSVEAYHKKMRGLIAYKDGASLIEMHEDWQTKIEKGDGKSYGIELFAQKRSGQFNGWLGYTLSKTTRAFPDLNGGKKFPFKYDRQHEIETTVAYEWKENKMFSFTWVYSSGAAVTIPTSSYQVHPGISVNNGYNTDVSAYPGRNNFRLRDYHRLDIAYSTTRRKKWGERTWTIGVYNAYNRMNPVYITAKANDEGKKFVQYTLLPIMPSISYRFKF